MQSELLYDVLQKRTHGISHHAQPSYEDHCAFVENHPYRAWFLVFGGATCLGSFYVHTDNTIGINITGATTDQIVPEVLTFVRNSFAPLDPIKSVRGAGFFVNVAVNNLDLIAALEGYGCNQLQVTYKVPDA